MAARTEGVQRDCPFRGHVELDESYFGPARTRDHKERGGRAHCKIMKNCYKTTLQAIISGRVHLSAELTTDGFRSYDGLVEAGFSKHQRINKYADPNRPVFSDGGVHINGIESFWSYARRRHQKFNGLRRSSFPAFLKETEFRFNNRGNDLYKLLLTSCRMEPLRR